MTLVIAHRGSGPLGPERENTVAAFLASNRLGADGVEFDVRRSADQQLVVHHDAVLETGSLVCDTHSSDLPSEIPSFAEALDACGGMLVNVEVKNVKVDADFDPTQLVARLCARLLLERGALEWGSGEGAEGVVVSSFSRSAIQAVKSVAPTLETAWIVGLNLRDVDVLTIAAADGLEGIHPYDPLVDGRLVEAAHAAGLALRVWTVDDPKRVAELGLFGVDAVITNDVVSTRRALAEPELAKEPAGREQSQS
ncbi:MAG: glycerophosphodiester phosphodiesterase [Acidimicrobiales bacterium]